jgi:hypothetical protein
MPHSEALKPFTCATMRAAFAEQSNDVIVSPQGRPSRTADHKGPTPIPAGLIAYIPVTTTLEILPILKSFPQIY